MQLTPEEIEHFSNEARTIANLKHPYIIQVHDFGIEESTGTPFLVMDYAPNGTLRQQYKKGRGSPRLSSCPISSKLQMRFNMLMIITLFIAM